MSAPRSGSGSSSATSTAAVQPPEPPETREPPRFVMIELPSDGGARVVGLAVEAVIRVFDVDWLAPVPRAPACVLGVVAHQGRIVTLFAARALLDGVADVRLPAQAILLDAPSDRGRWALLVSRVCGVARRDEIELDGAAAASVGESMARWNGALIRLLAPDALREKLEALFRPLDRQRRGVEGEAG